MDIARHMALLDELCVRPFPAGHGSSHGGPLGPGHHVVVLAGSHSLRADPASWAATVEQIEAECEALRERLTARWGPPDLWNLQTVLLRTEREEMPEPWAWLSARACTAWLWEVEGTGRWAAVAVAERDGADGVQLLAVVSGIPPV